MSWCTAAQGAKGYAASKGMRAFGSYAQNPGAYLPRRPADDVSESHSRTARAHRPGTDGAGDAAVQKPWIHACSAVHEPVAALGSVVEDESAHPAGRCHAIRILEARRGETASVVHERARNAGLSGNAVGRGRACLQAMELYCSAPHRTDAVVRSLARLAGRAAISASNAGLEAPALGGPEFQTAARTAARERRGLRHVAQLQPAGVCAARAETGGLWVARDGEAGGVSARGAPNDELNEAVARTLQSGRSAGAQRGAIESQDALAVEGQSAMARESVNRGGGTGRRQEWGGDKQHECLRCVDATAYS
jgi:hypothetical protein